MSALPPSGGHGFRLGLCGPPWPSVQRGNAGLAAGVQLEVGKQGLCPELQSRVDAGWCDEGH